MTDSTTKFFPGMVLTAVDGASGGISEILTLSDGRIVAVGTAYVSKNNVAAVACYTADGLPDTSFSGDGALTTNFGGSSSMGESVHLLSDGGFLVTGSEYHVGLPNQNGRTYLVAAQYTASGVLNPALSADGMASLDDGKSDTQVEAVVASPDGGLVIVGDVHPTGQSQIEVSRVGPDFRFDTSFGSGGRQRIDAAGSNYAFANDVTLLPDGKIVVVGGVDLSNRRDLLVARLNADGTPDSSFSDDGLALIAFGGDYSTGTGYSVAIQPDGKILVVGSGGPANAGSDFAVCRFNRDGSPDASFSGDGKLTTDFGGGLDQATCVAIQSDGKIVVGGVSRDAKSENMAIARYLPNGSLDTTFSGDGKLTIDFQGSTDSISAITVLDNGKILLAGCAAELGSFTDFALVRLNADGSLDTRFGAGAGANTPPFITSFAGQENPSTAITEDALDVTTLVAKDNDGDPLSFSITGGADRALFRVDAATGRLSFARAPDFEAPGDANKDNDYEVIVAVSDGHGGSDSQSWTIRVLNGPEWIRGTDGPDVLIGTSAGEVIDGLGGRDRLQGGGGTDRLVGGADIDTVVYTGPRSEYQVSARAATVASVRDGSDYLEQIERVKFSDVSIAYDIDGSAGTVARYLGAVFGKEAVANKSYVGIGLDLLDAGMSSDRLMQMALESALGPGYAPAAEVNLLYRNVLGRSADASEQSYWTGELLRGAYDAVSLAQMAALLDLNANNIGLAGLHDTGLPYLGA
ncbi:DUF4214 domain-containing protein [Aquabacterium sp.]|uniref:DUF4214 domain-containing protein n=1 Tax=Aquabacterium sp. TaxID=1872578 RepID=UPI003784082E